MEPSYLEGRTAAAESLRRLLFAAGIAVMDANNDISGAGLALFEQFFGGDAISEKLDIEKTQATLDDRTKQVNVKATHAQKCKCCVICVVSHARMDGLMRRNESCFVVLLRRSGLGSSS